LVVGDRKHPTNVTLKYTFNIIIYHFNIREEPDAVVHTCNPSTWEAKVRG
jgi:hypothetical protein